MGNARRGTPHGEAPAMQNRINRILRSKGIEEMSYRRARGALQAEYKAMGRSNAEIAEALKAADAYFIDELGISMETTLTVPGGR